MSGVEDFADRDRGVDQADVRVGLRKVAEQGAGRRLDVFREQPERVRVLFQALEERHGLVHFAHHRERLRPPERADRKRAGGIAEVVRVLVAQHQALGREQLLVGAHRGSEARIHRIHQADRRQQQVRGVGILPVERLREEAQLLVVGALEDDCLFLVRPRAPLARALGHAEEIGQLRAAVGGDPAHRLRKGVVARLRPVLPQSGVDEIERLDRLVDEMLDERRQRRVLPDHARIGEDRLEAENHLAVDVVLALHVRGVADSHLPCAVVAAQVREKLLVQIALAGNPVHRLQRPVVGHLAEKPHERFAFGEVAQSPQRLDDKGGVAQPAEAVIPRPSRANRFRNAGRRRGDDRAGVVVGMQLEAERGAQHRLRRELRQRAGLGPGPPAADGLLEYGLRIGRRPNGRRLAGTQRKEGRPIQADRGAVDQVRRRHVGREIEPRRATHHFQARARRDDLDIGARVIGPRIEMDVDARRAGDRHQQPAHFDRRLHLQAFHQSRREIVQLETAASGVHLGAHNVGVAHVARGRVPVIDRLERPAAATLLIEQPAEHRRAVEARQAQPVDAGVGGDEGDDATVANRAVIQAQRGQRTSSIRRTAADSSSLAQSKTVCEPTRARMARMRRRCSSPGINSAVFSASANESTAKGLT